MKQENEKLKSEVAEHKQLVTDLNGDRQVLQNLLEKQQEEAENALNDLKEKHKAQSDTLNTKIKRL